MDAGWGHAELEAQTSTLSPPNFMTPDKITSLLFFSSCKSGMTFVFKVALKIEGIMTFFFKC